MIYVILATSVFASEFLLWSLRASFPGKPRLLKHITPDDAVDGVLRQADRSLTHAKLRRAETQKWIASTQEHLQRLRRWWMGLNFTDRLGLVLRFHEVANMAWLIYIVCAQTIGSYRVTLIWIFDIQCRS